jgi:predicted restriction endonuclease
MAEWARKVLERDGYKCQWPEGCQTRDNRIDPHHIAERSLRPDLKYVVSNGKALCRTHHDWVPLHRQEAIAMGLLSEESYEAARKK